MKFLDEIKFDDKGLIPAVIQDYQNGEILMLAYMNRESLQKTLSSGKTHFWSRSRQKFWLKGESSGHVQEIKEVFIDCDMDTLVFKVDQKVAACHTGYRSCFYRKIEGEELTVVGEKVFEEGDVYKKS
ncbi:MAG: phosphoribosyl-AMP cyclohydrolase [Deltaproteobacteria bacterium]|nr:phosphoribosyl-AMP cyclohydrolase [Pseudomonadota bacterium]MCK5011963.1 phosphoribosyl-AMP cyclohydrolase [Deltaproteobacteria bacterium]MCK5514510.1 phosphoribosyl-AMP cyclohydrolase [Deltaproteobacteria bacterium]